MTSLADFETEYFYLFLAILIALGLLWAFLAWQRVKFPTGSSSTFQRNGKLAIGDVYQTLEEVQKALRVAGLESSSLIVGIDYTKSNEYTGTNSFNGRCLHEIRSGFKNPYQRVIEIIGKTLESFDDDKMIPVFGFGDTRTTNRRVFPFFEDRACYTFQEVLDRYEELTPLITLSGPTNFGPLIREAINIVKEDRKYYILIIIADGQVTDVDDTSRAIVEASNYSLSIIMIGVGDGPFDLMQHFDDNLPERRFDNFQFVHFEAVTSPKVTKNPESFFAMNALMEIPMQFKQIRELKLLK